MYALCECFHCGCPLESDVEALVGFEPTIIPKYRVAWITLQGLEARDYSVIALAGMSIMSPLGKRTLYLPSGSTSTISAGLPAALTA